jgi:hypothetical protein
MSIYTKVVYRIIGKSTKHKESRHITYHYFNHLSTISFCKSNGSTIGFVDSCGSHTNLMVDSPIYYMEMGERWDEE